MSATVTTTRTAVVLETARREALTEAVASLSFKDGSAVVALSVPQAATLVGIAATGKARTVQHASADALYRLALVDHVFTKPGIYWLTGKGTALIKRATKEMKATPAPVVVEVVPAAKAKIAKASKELGAKHFSHTDCAHDKTPAARAICRKAHAKA